MALWTYETSFESSEGYSTGNLGGQGSWTANVNNLTVTNAQAYAGTQSVTGNTGANRECVRTVATANTDGTFMYISLRASSVASASSNGGYYLQGSGTNFGGLYFNAPSAANISWRISGGTDAYTVLVASANANQWYRIGVEMDFTNDRVRCNVDGGAFGSYITGGNAFSQVDKMFLTTNGGTAFDLYYDSISPNYATASGPANLKSLDTNVKANIKSYNTNLLANIKSINTNA